jgi:hypothetical protein
MIRASIYARFSRDLQCDRSIDDQIAVCGEYAARNGYDVAVRRPSNERIHFLERLRHLLDR